MNGYSASFLEGSMDVREIQSQLKSYKTDLEKNSYGFDGKNPTKISKFFKDDGFIERAIRWFFGFDNLKNYSNESFIKRQLRKVTGCYEPKAIELIRVFISSLDDLEQQPVEFGNKKNNLEFKPWTESAEKISGWASATIFPELKNFGAILQARCIGLKYRIEKENGGLDKSETFEKEVYEELLKEANRWNHAQFNKKWDYITKKQRKKIEEVCKYQNYAQLLIQNPELRNEFYKWIIQYENDVSTLVEFSGTMEWMGSLVTKRFKDASKVDFFSNGSKTKHLFLPFAGKPLSVLNRKQKITLEKDWTLPLVDIIKEVQLKKTQEGRINFYSPRGLGFTNYHILKMGPYNPKTQKFESLNMDNPEWYKEVPVIEEFTEKEFRKRYHKIANLEEDLAQGNGYSIGCASRSSATMDVSGTHGWPATVYVDSKSKTYIPIHSGKFPDTYPLTPLGIFLFLGNVYKANFGINDDNPAYDQRCQTYHVTQLEKTALEKSFTYLAYKVKKAREGNIAFQIGGKGCAGFTANKYKRDRIASNQKPINLYECDVMVCTPRNPILSAMHKTISFAGSKSEENVFRFVMLILVPMRSITVERKKDGKITKVTHSLMNSPLWKKLRMHHPAILFESQIKEMREYAKGEKTWDQAEYLNHWDEELLKKGKFIGFLQQVYNDEKPKT